MKIDNDCIKRIHVNQHKIRRGEPDVISVKSGGKTYIGTNVQIIGPSRIVHSPNKPLSCGAKVWIETTASVVINEGDV